MVSTSSYRALLDDAALQLSDTSDTPRIDAEVLMQHMLQRPLAWLIAYGGTVATADHIKEYAVLVEARREGKPIAYLTGHKEFWSLDLAVNSAVLVPRADTETLIEHALKLVEHVESPKLLDLGTGSGAIALALAKERPDAEILAVDISPAALEVAMQNADRHALNNVRFKLSQWYQNIGAAHFDMIVANPPYVAAEDPHLDQGDLPFEPDLALIADEAGFADLRHIVKYAPDFLSKNGALVVEHGYEQGQFVAQFFAAAGFEKVCLHYDLNELPRCTSGILSSE